jgi:hypothetical protein
VAALPAPRPCQTLDDVREAVYHPLAFRYLLLTASYRTQLELTDDALAGGGPGRHADRQHVVAGRAVLTVSEWRRAVLVRCSGRRDDAVRGRRRPVVWRR